MKLIWLLPIGFLSVSAPHRVAAQCCPIQNRQVLNDVSSDIKQMQQQAQLAKDIQDNYRQTQAIQQQTQAAESTKRQLEMIDAHEYHLRELQYDRAQTAQQLRDVVITAPLQDKKKPDHSIE